MGYRKIEYGEIGIIASNIKELRKRKNESQEQLAYAISNIAPKRKISKSAISKIENEDAKLTIDNAIRIAKHYSTSVDWICGLTDDMSIPDNTIDVLCKYIDIGTHNITFFRNHEIPYIRIDKGLFDYLTTINDVEQLKKKFACDDIIDTFIKDLRQRFISMIRNKQSNVSENPVFTLLPNEYINDDVMDLIKMAYKTISNET